MFISTLSRQNIKKCNKIISTPVAVRDAWGLLKGENSQDQTEGAAGCLFYVGQSAASQPSGCHTGTSDTHITGYIFWLHSFACFFLSLNSSTSVHLLLNICFSTNTFTAICSKQVCLTCGHFLIYLICEHYSHFLCTNFLLIKVYKLLFLLISNKMRFFFQYNSFIICSEHRSLLYFDKIEIDGAWGS